MWGEVSPPHTLVPVARADVEVMLAEALEVEPGLRRDVEHVGADGRLERGDAVGPVFRAGGHAQRVPEGLDLRRTAVDFEARETGLAGVAERAQRAERNHLEGHVVEAAAGAELQL